MKFREELKKDFDKRNLEPNDKIIQEIIQKTKKNKIKKFPSVFNLRGVACAVIVFAIIFTALFPYYKGLNSSINIGGLYNKYKKYGDIYSQISKYRDLDQWENFSFISNSIKENLEDETLSERPEYNSSVPIVEPTTGEDEIDYSDTNLQVVGVSEADIIKTNGSYIYALSYDRSCLYIVKVDGINMELVNTIEMEEEKTDENFTENISYFEFYITENKLIVLNQKSQYYSERINNPNGNLHGNYYIGGYDTFYKNYTGAVIYDITDIANPVCVNNIGTSGSYVSSRMIDDILYLVTDEDIYNNIDVEDPLTYVPAIYNDSEINPVQAEDIMISNNPVDGSYVSIASIDTKNPEDVLAVKSIFGSGSEIYSSLEYMYIISPRYSSFDSLAYSVSVNYTDIIKIALNSGNVEIDNVGTVKGTVLNQYSMDEYNGYFRIVTTVDEYSYSRRYYGDRSSRTNALYVLDDQLQVVGSITGLAEDESVYSVRFDGEVGYFVTFRQTDPLFTVDLSDPTNPTVLSALKIPGFSTYMHPFGEGLLFGFGMSANERTGRTSGLKFSMFDVSDPLNVTEQNVYYINEYYSAALDNPKAILVSAERNLICLPTETGYKIFQYNTETGFELKTDIRIYDINYYDSLRGLYIGDYMYISTYKGIMAYSLDTFECVGECKY